VTETSTDDTDEADECTTIGSEAPGYDGYAAVSLADDEPLLYDRDEEDARLRSDTVVALETVV